MFPKSWSLGLGMWSLVLTSLLAGATSVANATDLSPETTTVIDADASYQNGGPDFQIQYRKFIPIKPSNAASFGMGQKTNPMRSARLGLELDVRKDVIPSYRQGSVNSESFDVFPLHAAGSVGLQIESNWDLAFTFGFTSTLNSSISQAGGEVWLSYFLNGGIPDERIGARNHWRHEPRKRKKTSEIKPEENSTSQENLAKEPEGGGNEKEEGEVPTLTSRFSDWLRASDHLPQLRLGFQSTESSFYPTYWNGDLSGFRLGLALASYRVDLKADPTTNGTLPTGDLSEAAKQSAFRLEYFRVFESTSLLRIAGTYYAYGTSPQTTALNLSSRSLLPNRQRNYFSVLSSLPSWLLEARIQKLVSPRLILGLSTSAWKTPVNEETGFQATVELKHQMNRKLSLTALGSVSQAKINVSNVGLGAGVSCSL